MTWSSAARDVPSLRQKEYGMVDMPVPQPPDTAFWQKSNASGDESRECVEVTCTHEHVWVRDSKNPLGRILGLTREGWAAFLVGVQRGQFDCIGVPA